MVTQEQRQLFRLRLKDLLSYREQNPGMGYIEWRANLPDNLRNTDDNLYDMYGAYLAKVQPEYNEYDNSYHLPTRDPNTGRILKKALHPTFLIGLQEDAKLGYYPYYKNGKLYTDTWEGNIQSFLDSGISGLLKYNGPMYYELKEDIRKLHPEIYNRMKLIYASEKRPISEIITWKDSLNVPDIEFESFPTKLASWITPANRILKDTNIKPKGFGISNLLDFIGLAADEKEIQQSENPKLERELREYNTRANIGLDDYGKEEIINAKYLKFLDGGQVTPSYINHWTGKPISTGAVTPVVDLRIGVDFTPVGDALAVKDAYDAAKNKDWSGMSWALASLIPFIPSSVSKASKLIKRPIPKVNNDNKQE